MALFGLLQTVLSVDGRANLIAFESQHARKRLRHALIVIDNQDLRRRRVGNKPRHRSIVTDRGSTESAPVVTPELDKFMLNFGVYILVLIQSLGGAR